MELLKGKGIITPIQRDLLFEVNAKELKGRLLSLAREIMDKLKKSGK